MEESKISREERALVQATVTFQIDVQSLVKLTKVSDGEALQEWLTDQAFKQLAEGQHQACEATVGTIVPVAVTRITAEQFTDQSFGDATWNNIKGESDAIVGAMLHHDPG